MKKYICYMIGLMLALSACKKFEDAPKDTVDTRLNEKISDYQAQLVSSQFGWKGYLLTASKIPVIFTFKFDDKNRVLMTANYKSGSPESSYRIKALQQPTLIFDTYSLIHLLADPDPNVFDGDAGAGYSSDFEFGVISSSTDTIHMVGLTNKSKLTLIRATENVTISNIFKEKEALENIYGQLRTYFKRINLGGTECEVNLNPDSRLFTASYLDGGVLKTVSSVYYISGTSIGFFEPLEIGNTIISSISNINFDAGTNVIKGRINGSEIQIKEANAPLQYNKSDAPNFLLPHIVNTTFGPSNQSWWESTTGFTIDGKIDAFNIKSITGFTDLDYYVAGTSIGNFVCFAGRNYSYYYKLTSSISPDGYLINKVTSTVGSTTSVPDKTIIDNTTLAFIHAKGFYVIRVGNGFDIVSVEDARSWISFK